uniref:Uncharacterized protein n=1 Tax=Rhinolophus ferrumequinum TaxID=59479 RepID=A0A671F4E3_RHIFE
MNSLRVILQGSPYKWLWRRFQLPRSVPARPCSLYTCTYKTRNRALVLSEKVQHNGANNMDSCLLPHSTGNAALSQDLALDCKSSLNA